MPYQNIDAVLAPDDVQAIKDSLNDILSRLPFVINLTEDERKQITKTGEGSVAFVQDALTGLQANPTVFPAALNAASFKKDVDLFTVLSELTPLVESLAEKLDDTRMAVGGEAMQSANQVYAYAKTAQKTTPGMKPLVDKLAARYAKLTGPRKKTTPTG